MKVGVLFSGGKDSVLSLCKSMKDHDVRVLITIESKNPDSYMFHTPSIPITKLQSEALNVPQIYKTTQGIKESELGDLRDAILEAKNKFSVEGIVSGAIASNYQKSRIEKICEELNLESITPLWGKNTKDIMQELIEKGFKVVLTSVAAEGLGKEWLGREINSESFKELCDLSDSCYVNIAGEGGEFESLVIDGPIFKKYLKIVEAKVDWRDSYGLYTIEKISLENKY